jgi:hypothetical protein
MRRKFAAAQSGLRRREKGDILLFSDEWEKGECPLFPSHAYRGLHFAPPILSLNQ